jgi:hypothetical protein
VRVCVCVCQSVCVCVWRKKVTECSLHSTTLPYTHTQAIHGSYKISYTRRNKPLEGETEGKAEQIEVDFTPPFRRMSMISGLEEHLDIQIPSDYDRCVCVCVCRMHSRHTLSLYIPVARVCVCVCV